VIASMSRMRDLLRRRWRPGLRIQLTLLYTAVFALLLLLCGFILYAALQASLSAGIDTTLQLRAQQIASGITSDGDKISIQDVAGELPGLTGQVPTTNTTRQQSLQSDVTFGILIRVLDTQAHVSYVSPAFQTLTVPSASITQPLHGAAWRGTVLAHNGQAVRLYSIALKANGTTFGVLQVGESLAQLDATLQSVVIVLLIIDPFVLLLSAFGSYWLAKRAFRPMLHLTRTTREINAGDLHRRVPLPHARDEVYDLALTLNDMIARLDQAFARQRRFVADASHELRTPVTAIRSMTDIALDNELSLEECRGNLRDVNAEAERLGLLISDLLALARADEAQLPLDHEPVRLDLLAVDVAATMEPLALERGITLQVQTPEPVPIIGDTARLIQMMMGLVENALTYTNACGIVTLIVRRDGTQACLQVRDTGIGIAPEDAAHIFERFYRADPARSRAAGGSGLGLSIVDWIVRVHNGSISVESQVGQGSMFTVMLPLAPSRPGQTPGDHLISIQAKTAET
jgi:heavy metal sensor kinase